MIIFPRSSQKEIMEVTYSIAFNGKIWNQRYNDSNKTLCIEERNEDEFITVFHTIPLDKPDQMHSFKSTLSDWWCGLEYLNDQYLIVHGYKEDQSIEKQGIAIHTHNGELSFMDQELTFHSIVENTVIVTNEQKELFPIRNGKITTIDELTKEMNDPIHSSVVSPIHYMEEDTYFTTVAQFLKQKYAIDAITGLDYLETGQSIIISFNTREDQKITNRLVILNKEGQEQFNTILNSNLSGIGFGTFYLIDDKLIYIIDNTTLEIVTPIN